MKGGKRKGAGRKRIELDLAQVEQLCTLGCSDAEIAAVFNVSVRTVESRKKEGRFADAMERGRAKARINIRRHQWKLLEAGSAPMAIWLGKQYLNQRDVTPVEVTGPDKEPVRLTTEMINEILKH